MNPSSSAYQEVVFFADQADSKAQSFINLSPPQQLDSGEPTNPEPLLELSGRRVGAVHLGQGHTVATQGNRSLAIYLHAHQTHHESEYV